MLTLAVVGSSNRNSWLVTVEATVHTHTHAHINAKSDFYHQRGKPVIASQAQPHVQQQQPDEVYH